MTVTRVVDYDAASSLSGIAASTRGDLDVLMTTQDAGTVSISTAGFVQVASYSATEWIVGLWVRRCDGTEGSSVTVNYSGHTVATTRMTRFRGTSGLVHLFGVDSGEDTNTGTDGYNLVAGSNTVAVDDVLGVAGIYTGDGLLSVVVDVGTATLGTADTYQALYGSRRPAMTTATVTGAGSGSTSLNANGTSGGQKGAAIFYLLRDVVGPARVSGSSPTAGTSTVSVPYPSNVDNGDMLILWIAADSTGISTPSGFNAWGVQQSGAGWFIHKFYRDADGTETGNVSVTCSGSTKSIGWMSRYIGPDGYRPDPRLFTSASDSDTGANGVTTTTTSNSCGTGDLIATAYIGNQATVLSSRAVTHAGSTVGMTVNIVGGSWDSSTKRYNESEAVNLSGGANNAYSFTANGTDSDLTGITIFGVLRLEAWTNPDQTANPGVATATGTANDATAATAGGGSGTNNPTAWTAFAHGEAIDVPIPRDNGTDSIHVEPPGESAVAAGTANNPAASVTVNPTAATGTGTAYQPTIASGQTALPSAATGAGTAYIPTIDIAEDATASAGAATGTGTAYNPTVSTSETALPGAATGAGAAYSPTIGVGATASPGVATGAGTAYAPTILIVEYVTPGTATGTGTGYAPSLTATANATPGTATGLGSAGNPQALDYTPSVVGTSWLFAYPPFGSPIIENGPPFDADAEAATGTGTAYNPTVAITVQAGNASATGAANNPDLSTDETAQPTTATGAGTAYNPTVDTASQATADAITATGVGAAYAPTLAATATVTPDTAAGTGTAYQPTVTTSQTALPGAATGTGTAYQPTIQTAEDETAFPITATGVGTAYNPSIGILEDGLAVPATAVGVGAAYNPSVATSVTVTAQVALATGTAYDATVDADTYADAITATATGTAYQPTVQSAGGVDAEPALATGTAYSPVALAQESYTAQAVTATATATGYDPSLSILVSATVATGSGVAYDATVDYNTIILCHYWDGSAWAQGTLRYWNGSAWQGVRVHYWTGSEWS